ncbi:MAG: hypothetical protein HYY18_10855 [Planctomycetes bacterium]|nr:hypothetical protein [Planctomycetota bacterium]
MPMRCRFAFLIALEYAAVAAVLIHVSLQLHERRVAHSAAAMSATGPGPVIPELTPADAVFLPFYEGPSEIVARPIVPDADGLTISMLKGWYAGRFEEAMNEEGELERGEVFEFLIEEDGRWACAAIRSAGCMIRYRHSLGRAMLVNGRVLFESDEIDGEPSLQICVVLPVWWGDRLYLLGPGDVARFCDLVNWGGEPRGSIRFSSGKSYVRTAPSPFCTERAIDTSTDDRAPLLPEPAASWILRAPVEGRLTEALPDRIWKADIGTGQGVFRGMTLRARADGSEFRVVEVGSDSCVVCADKDPGSSGAAGTAIWSDAKGANLRR